ncbi:MAG: acyl carrier protein [Planctomycetes bacterium]|nr:acyl carrier protein [Planctomycetota bacterium]
MENLNETILAVVLDVVREKSPEIEAVRPDQMLVEDLGLRSLDLARIIAKLEMKLDVDPFAELVAVTSIRTPGDLSAAYAKCFSTDEEPAPEASKGTGPICAKHPSGRSAANRTRPPRAGLASQRELRQKARGEQSQ